MDKERMAESEKIEAHGAENGWVAPMAEEDREFFAYFRSVFKRYKHRLTRAHREKQLKTSCQALHNAPPNRT